jgi:Predicted Zn-dependent peptidases
MRAVLGFYSIEYPLKQFLLELLINGNLHDLLLFGVMMLKSSAILLLGSLLLTYVATSRAGEPANSNDIFPYPVAKTVLDNGLTILTIPYDSPGLVAYYTVVRTGSRNEIEPGLSGFAHFFEHIMFRGTLKYPADKYNDVLKHLGADSNAFTTDDWTCYHVVASSDALETLADVESDRFMNLKYSEEAFKTEAGAILGEYNKNYSVPFQSMFETLQNTAYTTHTYKHTTMGFLADIKDMPNQYEYSLKFFDRFYRPENCTVVVVGDVKNDDVVRIVKKYYSGWKKGTYQVQVPEEPPQKEEKVVHMPWKNKTLPYLLIGYHVPAFSDTDVERASLDILSQLVFSESSPLYQSLVIKKQLVEFVDGGSDDHRDPYLFTVMSRIKDVRNIDSVRSEIYASLENARTVLVDAKKLQDIKSHIRYAFAMQLNKPDNVAVTVASYIALTGNYESMNKVYSLYDKVTADDIMRAAQKYFTRENRTVVILEHEASK